MCLLLFAPKANFAQEHLWESSDAGQSPPCAPGATRAPRGRAQRQAEGNRGQAEHPVARRRGGWVPGWVGSPLNRHAMPCPSAPCGARPSPGLARVPPPSPVPKSLGAAQTHAEAGVGLSTAPTAPPAPTAVPAPSRSLPGHRGRWGPRAGGGHAAAQPSGGTGSARPVGTPGDGEGGGTRGRPRGVPSAVPPAPGAQRGQPRAARPR